MHAFRAGSIRFVEFNFVFLGERYSRDPQKTQFRRGVRAPPIKSDEKLLRTVTTATTKLLAQAVACFPYAHHLFHQPQPGISQTVANRDKRIV